MANALTIKAEERKEVGKKIAKKLRNEGRIPGVVYGGDEASLPVSLLLDDVKAILKSEKGENTLLKIMHGKSGFDAMLQEVQYDYLSDNVIHVDLIRVDTTKPVNVTVHIKLKGEPLGVKVEGGTLDFNTREVRINCSAHDIPSQLLLDVTGLHVGQSVKAMDLELPGEARLLSAPHAVICTVVGKAKEEEAELVEEEEAAAAAEAGEEPASKEASTEEGEK